MKTVMKCECILFLFKIIWILSGQPLVWPVLQAADPRVFRRRRFRVLQPWDLRARGHIWRKHSVRSAAKVDLRADVESKEVGEELHTARRQRSCTGRIQSWPLAVLLQKEPQVPIHYKHVYLYRKCLYKSQLPLTSVSFNGLYIFYLNLLLA